MLARNLAMAPQINQRTASLYHRLAPDPMRWTSVICLTKDPNTDVQMCFGSKGFRGVRRRGFGSFCFMEKFEKTTFFK